MTVKYHKFTIEGKEYKIKKMGLRDALWVSAQIGNITATPIISLILDFTLLVAGIWGRNSSHGCV